MFDSNLDGKNKEIKSPEEIIEGNRLDFLKNMAEKLNEDHGDKGLFSVSLAENHSCLYMLDYKSTDKKGETSNITNSGYFKKIFSLLRTMQEKLEAKPFDLLSIVEKTEVKTDSLEDWNFFDSLKRFSEFLKNIQIKSINTSRELGYGYIIIDSSGEEKVYSKERLIILLKKIDVLFA